MATVWTEPKEFKNDNATLSVRASVGKDDDVIADLWVVEADGDNEAAEQLAADLRSRFVGKLAEEWRSAGAEE